MASRLTLHEELCTILTTRNAYFQPPMSVQMKYPAIVYSLGDMRKLHANDGMYKPLVAYEVTLIDEDPDSELVSKILALPYCTFNRFYPADNLNHWVFTLYY